MHRRLYAQLAALSLLPALAGGCAQTTRHTNLIIFGTNTVVGLRVGASATEVPSIDLGFARQELVLMPVVANSAVDSQGRMIPCDMHTNSVPSIQPLPPPGGQAAPEDDPATNPCLLLGVRKGARDAYSVLASFGGHFGAGTSGGANASGGVSQYFATGMAAQLLALNGGAAVVSSGPAAEKASTNAPMTLEGASGKTPAGEAGIAAAGSYGGFEQTLLARVNAEPSDAALAASFAKFESDAGIKSTSVQTSCATKAACVSAINDGDYRQTYYMHSQALDAALAKW